MNHIAVDVGESIVAATVAIGQFCVVHPQEMQNGGMEIVNVNAVFRNGGPDFIGGPIGKTAFDSRAGHP